MSAQATNIQSRINVWLTPQRARTYPLLLLIAGAAVFIVSTLRANRWIEADGTVVGKDFLAFYMAGQMVRADQATDLYDFAAQQDWQNRFMENINPRWSGTCLYLNPPHYAWLMSRITRWGYGPAIVIWWSLSLAAFGVTIRIIRTLVDSHRWPAIILVTICFPPFLWALTTGQNALLTLLILTGFCALHVHKRPLAAGLLLSLLAFKFQFILIPAMILLITRQWRAIIGLAVGDACTLIFTLATMGADSVIAYIAAGSQISELMHTAGFDLHKQHCWTGLIALLGENRLSYSVIQMVGAALSIATLLLLYPVLRRGWSSDRRGRMLQWSAVLMASLAASPHLFHYDMLIAALPTILWFASSESDAHRRQYEALRAMAIVGFAWLAISLVAAPIIGLQLSPILMTAWVAIIASAFMPVTKQHSALGNA